MKAPQRDASGKTRWWKLNTQFYGGKILAAAGVFGLLALILYLLRLTRFTISQFGTTLGGWITSLLLLTIKCLFPNFHAFFPNHSYSSKFVRNLYTNKRLSFLNL